MIVKAIGAETISDRDLEGPLETVAILGFTRRWLFWFPVRRALNRVVASVSSYSLYLHAAQKLSE